MTESGELYRWYKSIGICPQCGTNKAAPNRVRCEECLVKNTESSAKSREKRSPIIRNEKHKSYMRNLRKIRGENGLCINCGNPICSTSTAYCIDCKVKNQRKNERRKSGIERVERPSYGLCFICGEPLDRKGKSCKKCAEKMTANLPKDRDNKNWRNDNRLIFGNGGTR